MQKKVGHEGTEPNHDPSGPTSQDRRRQREPDSNQSQSNQRSRIHETSAIDNNISSGSSVSVELLRQQIYLVYDGQLEEDAIHDSDNDDETVEESLVSTEGWNSWNFNGEDDQNQEVSSVLIQDVQFRIYNEDGVRTHRYDIGTLLSLNVNVGFTNIDGMSFEELMELQERIGEVERGLSRETISSHLKTRVHNTTSVDVSTEEGAEICTICQDEYENKDKIGTLDCQHEYHEDCITQWLVLKNVCPICKRQGLEITEENKRDVKEC